MFFVIRDELIFMPDALLVGRKTYQQFATIWPTRQGKVADRINRMRKYVVSRTLKGAASMELYAH